MREKPISVEISEASSLKHLSSLSKEIETLLISLMEIDKRTLRKEAEKARFKGKLQLYCTLYKSCREKFLKIKKQTNDNTNYYKTPLTFEELLKDFDWKKTVTYSQPMKKVEEPVLIFDDDDEDEDEVKVIEEIEKAEVNYLEELNKIFEKNMKKYINRNDPETIKDALTTSLTEFLDKYKEHTSEGILQKIYHELRKEKSGKTNTQVIKDRVGEEKIDEPLTGIIPTSGTEIEEFTLEIGTKVRFKYHDGMERIGEVLSFENENSIVVKGMGNNIKYPIKKLMILSIEVKKEEVSSQVEKAEKIVIDESDLERIDTIKDSKPFKEFGKDEKVAIIQSYYDGGLKKCGDVVSKMKEEGYIINHYDDVYNFFTKIKK